jgi:hypothetical protein
MPPIFFINMSNTYHFALEDRSETPTAEMLVQVLGDSYAAYDALQDALPDLEMEQQWQWYAQYKAWFAKGTHFWTTAKGAQKEKNLYWLYIYDGYFTVAIWFKEGNREAVALADVSEKTKALICNATVMGKMRTFPVVIEVTGMESLQDIYTLLDYKKRLELL